MNKLLSTLLGATFGALALTASAQTTSLTTPATPSAQNQAASTTVKADKKPAVKAKHHKHKKAKAKAATQN